MVSCTGGMPSAVPVSRGCCEHNEAGTEQEENEGTSGPPSHHMQPCDGPPLPRPQGFLSLDSRSLKHTEIGALGNMSPTSDGNGGPFGIRQPSAESLVGEK